MNEGEIERKRRKEIGREGGRGRERTESQRQGAQVGKRDEFVCMRRTPSRRGNRVLTRM